MQKLFHADSAARSKNEPAPRRSQGDNDGSGSASRRAPPRFRPINLTINFNNFGRSRGADKRGSSHEGSSVSTIIRHRTKRRKQSESRSRSNENAHSDLKDIREINEQIRTLNDKGRQPKALMVFFHPSSEVKSSQENRQAASEAGGPQVMKKRDIKAALKEENNQQKLFKSTRFNFEAQSHTSQSPISPRRIMDRHPLAGNHEGEDPGNTKEALALELNEQTFQGSPHKAARPQQNETGSGAKWRDDQVREVKPGD
jgi:hypothetical protein